MGLLKGKWNECIENTQWKKKKERHRALLFTFDEEVVETLDKKSGCWCPTCTLTSPQPELVKIDTS